VTRQEIARELDKIACEWRVPLRELRGNGRHGGRVGGIVAAARATFAKRMFVEGVQPGHVAWALNISPQCAARWFERFRKAERRWWAA